MEVQELISFIQFGDFKFCGGMKLLSIEISDGIWFLVLYDVKPTDIRFIVSKTVKSSTNLNLSFMSMKSVLLLDWLKYSKIPMVAPCGPPPLIFLGFDRHPCHFIPRFGHWRGNALFQSIKSVSYTHLTLPTILLV